jgi:hypothetical protein
VSYRLLSDRTVAQLVPKRVTNYAEYRGLTTVNNTCHYTKQLYQYLLNSCTVLFPTCFGQFLAIIREIHIRRSTTVIPHVVYG